MKFFKNPCNIYILLWCLYYLQGSLYNSGVINQIMVFALLIVSVYNFIIVLRNYQLSKFLKASTLLVFLFVLYGIIPIVFGDEYSDVSNFDYLKKVLISILPIYSFYLYSKRGYLSEDSLRRWAVVFYCVAIYSFYFDQSIREDALESAAGITSKKSYFVLSLLPLVPLFKKKIVIQYILMGIVVIFLLMGMKRGALLIGMIAETWLLWQLMFKKGTGANKRLLSMVLTIALIWLFVYSVGYYLSTNDYFNQRMEQTLDGNSSSRDIIYQDGINAFFNNNTIFGFLFGHGANSTLKIIGAYAHNDWIEIGINNGFVFILVFFVFWLRLYKLSRKTNKNTTAYQIITLFFLIYFIKTFFSMSYNTFSFFSTSVFGLALYLSETQVIYNNNQP